MLGQLRRLRLLPTPSLPAAIYPDPSQPTRGRVDDLLLRMTLDEKIGQMTQVEMGSIQPGILPLILLDPS